ncbi:MAG: hypothetical protein AAB371_02205 [Patescibacteria group bacterium]
MAEVFKEPQSEAEKKQDVEELREKFAELRERFSDALYERQLAENAERNFKGKKILADGSPTQEYTDLVRKYTECKELVESLKPELNALGSVIEIEELKEKKIRRERDGLVSEGYVEFDVNGGKAKILLGKYEKGNEVFFRVDEILLMSTRDSVYPWRYSSLLLFLERVISTLLCKVESGVLSSWATSAIN